MLMLLLRKASTWHGNTFCGSWLYYAIPVEWWKMKKYIKRFLHYTLMQRGSWGRCAPRLLTATWCLFQALWTRHQWPSAAAYADPEQSGRSTVCLSQDHGTSRRERGAVQFGTVTRQAPVITSWQAKYPSRSSLKTALHLKQAAPRGQWPRPQSVTESPSLLARPVRHWHRVGRGKKLECQPYDGWKEHQSQQLAKHCFVHLCVCLDIQAAFEQPLHQRLVVYTDNVNSPPGSSLHSGHMDNTSLW